MSNKLGAIQLVDLGKQFGRILTVSVGVERTLARTARQTHACILFDRIKAEYPNRILRTWQKARVIQEVLPG